MIVIINLDTKETVTYPDAPPTKEAVADALTRYTKTLERSEGRLDAYRVWSDDELFVLRLTRAKK